MATLNSLLPDALRSFVDRQVRMHGYCTESECDCHQVHNDRDRQHMRGLLLEGAASRQAGIADGGYFNSLRRRIRAAEHR